MFFEPTAYVLRVYDVEVSRFARRRREIRDDAAQDSHRDHSRDDVSETLVEYLGNGGFRAAKYPRHSPETQSDKQEARSNYDKGEDALGVSPERNPNVSHHGT